jgi:hypothetical protein
MTVRITILERPLIYSTIGIHRFAVTIWLIILSLSLIHLTIDIDQLAMTMSLIVGPAPLIYLYTMLIVLGIPQCSLTGSLAVLELTLIYITIGIRHLAKLVVDPFDFRRTQFAFHPFVFGGITERSAKNLGELPSVIKYKVLDTK